MFTLGAAVSALVGVLFDGTARPLMTLAAIGGAGAFLLRVGIRGKR
jgi:hypothetical protein